MNSVAVLILAFAATVCNAGYLGGPAIPLGYAHAHSAPIYHGYGLTQVAHAPLVHAHVPRVYAAPIVPALVKAPLPVAYAAYAPAPIVKTVGYTSPLISKAVPFGPAPFAYGAYPYAHGPAVHYL